MVFDSKFNAWIVSFRVKCVELLYKCGSVHGWGCGLTCFPMSTPGRCIPLLPVLAS